MAICAHHELRHVERRQEQLCIFCAKSLKEKSCDRIKL